MNREGIAVPQPVLAEIAYRIARLPSSTRMTQLRRRFALIRDEMPRSPWIDGVSETCGAI